MLGERIDRRIAFSAFALLAAAFVACTGGEEAPEAAESSVGTTAAATPTPSPSSMPSASPTTPTPGDDRVDETVARRADSDPAGGLASPTQVLSGW